MPRPIGSKNKDGYAMSLKALTQRRGVNLKTGERSKHLRELASCDTCPVANHCKYKDEKPSTDFGCEMVVNAYWQNIKELGSPLVYIAKDIADLDTRIQMQKILEGKQGMPLDKLTIQALELKMKMLKLMKEIGVDGISKVGDLGINKKINEEKEITIKL